MQRKGSGLAALLVISVFLASFLFFSAQVFSNPTSIECDGCTDCTAKLDGTYSEVILNTSINNYPGTCILFGADNITFNGNGSVIDGTGIGIGIDTSVYSNEIIKNTQIRNFVGGIQILNGNSHLIENNTITDNLIGVYIENSVSNEITNNIIGFSSISGIELTYLQNSKVQKNNIIDNQKGISLTFSDGNSIFYNNIMGNGIQASDDGNNNWHNGYPGGGNYWSDISCTDVMGGENQTMNWPDWICDLPYINGPINDSYPWIEQDLIASMPVLEPVPDIVAAVNNTVMITLNASDPNGNPLAYYINDTARFSQNSNVFTWQTGPGDEGNYSFILWTSDGTYNATQMVNVEIINAFSVHHFVPAFPATVHNSAAAAQSVISYIGNTSITQQEIYDYGVQYNLPQTPSGKLDPSGMDAVIGKSDPYDFSLTYPYNQFDSNPGGNPYQGYNFAVEAFGTQNFTDYIRDIAHWMDYRVPLYFGNDTHTNPEKVPPVVPTYGSYDNWVVVNGFASDVDPLPNDNNPYEMPGAMTIYGFWLTNPNVGEPIGTNTFITANEAQSTYFLPIVSSDIYNGKFVQVAEPPEVESTTKVEVANVKKTMSGKTLANSIKRATKTKKIGVFDSSAGQSYEAEQKLGITRTNWDEIIPSYVRNDPAFADAYEGANPARYFEVSRENGNEYYIVTFEKKNKNKRKGLASVSLILDNEGSFNQITYTETPQPYMSINEKQAIKLVMKYLNDKNLKKKPRIRADLIWEPGEISSSPFYPYWEIRVNRMVFYVDQNGKVFPPRMSNLNLIKPQALEIKI